MAGILVAWGAPGRAAASPSPSSTCTRRVKVQLPSGAPLAQLHGVTAISASDAWAVGYYARRWGRMMPLAAHWDGTTWSSVPVPAPPRVKDRNFFPEGFYLSDVDAVAPSNVWAIGGGVHYPVGVVADHIPRWPAPELRYVPLLFHWNGVRWGRLPLPRLGGRASFAGLDVVGPGDVWVVGAWQRAYAPHSRVLPLFMHWDGAGWEVRHPDLFPGRARTQLSGVTTTSSSSTIALGVTSGGSQGAGGTFTATLGAGAWLVTPAPSGISHLSGDWGVGGSTKVPDPNTPSGFDLSFSAYLRGPTGWDLVPTPPLDVHDTQDDLLIGVTGTGVADLGPSDAWLVGNDDIEDGGFSDSHAHAERWDGTAWSVVPLPRPLFTHWVSGVDADPATGATFIVGGVRILSDENPHAARNRMEPLVFQGTCA